MFWQLLLLHLLILLIILKNFDSSYNLLMRLLSPPMEQVGPANEKKFFLYYVNVILFICVGLCVYLNFTLDFCLFLKWFLWDSPEFQIFLYLNW